MMAYGVAAFALAHAWSLRRRAPASPAASRANWLAGLVLAQMGLGIATLLLVVPLWAALAHQIFAMAVLGVAVAHATLSEARAAPVRA
jgi:cytochrome c oxidase assembly protein subunit 15